MKFKVQVTLTEVSVAQYEVEAENDGEANQIALARARHSRRRGTDAGVLGPRGPVRVESEGARWLGTSRARHRATRTVIA